jgi:ATP dependent DNA ligase domain
VQALALACCSCQRAATHTVTTARRVPVSSRRITRWCNRQRRKVRALPIAPPEAHWLTDESLIELNGDDLRREPLEVRKATLASVLAKSDPGLRLSEHLEHEDGEVVFPHACKPGLEGIVSKRLGSAYRSGRSPDWLKMKNPDAPAVKREAEEDWGKEKWR